MNLTRKSAIAILLTLTMVMAAPATAAPASGGPNIDTETATTTNQSATQDGDTISDFNASPTANFTYTFIGWNGTQEAESPMIRFEKNGSGYVALENQTLTNVTRASGGTRWNLTVTESALADVEHAINDNVTMDVTAYRNDTETSANTTYTLYLNTTDDRFVERVSDSDVDSADFVTVNEDNGTTVAGLTLPATENDNTALTLEDRSVNGSDTDAVIVFSNGTVLDDFEAAAGDTSPLPFAGGEAAEGDALLTMPLRVEGDGTTVAVPVFYKSAPDHWDTDQTYALYKTDIGGETGLVIKTGEDLSDADELTIESWGATGIRQAFSVYGATTVTGFDGALSFQTLSLTLGFDGNLFAASLVVVGLKRRERRRPPGGGATTASAGA